MIINSFFAKGSVPAIGLTPTISIWYLDSTMSKVPVVTQAMCNDIGDGFYAYDFTSFDDAIDYTVLVDAGSDMNPFGRYSTAAISADHTAERVWDVTAINHTAPGSVGEMLNHIKADTAKTAIDIVSLSQLLNTIKAYEANRTKIDASKKTLTVYDSDGTTPLQVFRLLDSTGVPSVSEVMERVPTL